MIEKKEELLKEVEISLELGEINEGTAEYLRFLIPKLGTPPSKERLEWARKIAMKLIFEEEVKNPRIFDDEEIV